MATLLNTANLAATIDGVPYNTASTEVSVLMSSVSLAKAADKTLWENGDLTYTITASNLEEAASGLDATGVVVTDTIDPDLATLIEGSVLINGAAPPADSVTFNATTGLLTVNLADIPPEGQAIITFRCKKV